ncbi:hypothetical protein ABFW14_34485, partial [Mycolicibacterium fortuitum]|uniref:hypothetical protein n=1 Tax=Mycolicibacterium fortuitum TaxID=1766 RepID=UPI0034CF3F55
GRWLRMWWRSIVCCLLVWGCFRSSVVVGRVGLMLVVGLLWWGRRRVVGCRSVLMVRGIRIVRVGVV